MKIEINRVNDAMHMEATNETGNVVSMDGSPEIGGVNAGARPMQLVLMGLGGCSSIDVLNILKKQKQVVDTYKVVITASRVDAVPSIFDEINIEFNVTGDVDENRLKRAIDLSVDKYCSVGRMIEKTAKITSSYTLNK
ncbi:MAG: OsmC family protein [Flavobacteriales bacterium]|nr:OsmC family protein [Flavobacteriales bacterium]